MHESSSTDRAAVRFPPPLVFLIGIAIGVALEYGVVPAPLPLARGVTVLAGLVLVAAGIALVRSARVHHVRTGQNPAPWKPSPALIFEGPYRFTRNPMYLAATIVQIGVGVAFNNLWIALFALPALAAVHFIAVRPEETYLTEKFGSAYAEYRRRVRRYL